MGIGTEISPVERTGVEGASWLLSGDISGSETFPIFSTGLVR